MAAVVLSSQTLNCADQGKAPLSGAAKLTVGSTAVVLASTASAAGPFASCTFQVSGANSPCATVTTATSDAAQKLTVGGQPVLLDSVSGTTNNGSSISASAGQNKLTTN